MFVRKGGARPELLCECHYQIAIDVVSRELIMEKKIPMMKFLIWSFEHTAWWKAGRNGYSKDVQEAGEYTFEEAEKICVDANRKQYNEAMIPL